MTTIKTISREPTEEMLEAGEDMASGRSGKVPVYPEDIFGAMFDAAPSLNPWVSVKERLPKITGSYLVKFDWQSKTDLPIPTFFNNHTGKFNHPDEIIWWWDESIMPIPRPEE